jgi:hypothetical protein
MKKRVLGILCLAVYSVSLAVAQVTVSTGDTPATKQDVQKLFEVMQINKQMHVMMNSMAEQMKTLMHDTLKRKQPGITDQELARADRYSSEVMKNYPIDTALEDMIPVYQKYLNKSDVSAMIDFYSTPTGKKLMQQMPQMTREAMQVSSARMQKQMETLMDKIEQMAREDAEEQERQHTGPVPSKPESLKN